ncbi:MAG TPA: hypothetical protein VJ691_10840 [Vicinamibacterales bacterium]|nr:hypothetical protein [Vicinamibacterales bacterium]
MSKKKGKPAARKAPKKTSRRAAGARGGTRLASSGTELAPTSQVTIFLFKTASGNRIRTAPQRAYAGPGDIEWTVVNLIDGSDVPVRITWVGQAPFKPLEFRNRHSEPVPSGVEGVFKYVVHAYDTQEDPEVEIPWA